MLSRLFSNSVLRLRPAPGTYRFSDEKENNEGNGQSEITKENARLII